MTNLEAITASIGIPGFSDGAVTKALLDAGLDPSGSYDPATTKRIDAAALVVLKGMLGLEEIQEGDYAVKYTIEKRIKQIEKDLGLTTGATVRNASCYW